jgi:hypothetical protein
MQHKGVQKVCSVHRNCACAETQAGGSTRGGETAGVDGLVKLSLESEGGCFDVTSDGACAWMFSFLEAVTVFDGPSKGADELCSLGAVGPQGFYMGTGDTLLVEQLNKMLGSRVSSVVISIADTASLLL